MKVIRARVLGFCMGVRRAVETASESLENNRLTGKKVFTLGPLIHNPLVMDSLEKKGAEVLENSSFCRVNKDSIVIIRAHGTTPGIVSELEDKGALILDATCPRVHLSQKRAAEWAARGFSVIIAGDKNHGEVVSISGYADNHAVVIESAEEASAMDIPKKSVLIAQTTFSPSEFKKISDVLKCRNPSLQIFNSICPATMERQNALKELENKTDGIIVIGGRNSANTRRLYETAASICRNSVLIENSSEIPDDFLGMNVIGLTAGASTPDSVIDDVEFFLLNSEK